MKSYAIDTGPLVALLNRRDVYHQWAKDILSEIPPPLVTCESVISEACFLVRGLAGGPAAVLTLIDRGVVRLDFQLATEIVAVKKLMTKYAEVPMSIAGACFVRMTELDTELTVITMDSDFRIYRRNQRQMIPVLSPEQMGR